MNKILTIALLSLALLMPATQAAANEDHLCDGHSHQLDIQSQYNIQFDHGDVVTRDDGKELMRVTADGNLFIKGQRRAVDPAQAALLRVYVTDMNQLVDDAKEVGKAGAELGVKIAGEVIAALFDGDLDKVKEHAHAQADAMKETAKSLCVDVEALRTTQLKLRQSIPEMAPYLPLANNVI